MPFTRAVSIVLALAVPMCALGQAVVSTIAGPTPGPVAVNPVTHRAYYANREASISVVEGTSEVARIALPHAAASLLMDAAANLLFVPSNDNTLSIVDLNTNAVRTFTGIGGGTFALDDANHRVFASSTRVGEILMLDGAGNRSTLTVPFVVCGMAVNGRTNHLFVSHCGKNQVAASVVDLASGAVTTVPFPGATSAGPIAVNKSTNRAYIASYDGRTEVLVIDGFTKDSRVLDFGTGQSRGPDIVANSSDKRVYVTWGAMLGIIDGATDTIVATRFAADWILAPRVDEATHRVYAVEYTRGLLTIDANGGLVTTKMPFDFGDIAVDAARQRIYVSGDVAALIDTAAAPTPRYNYQGLWWNAPAGSEAGWGVNIAQQGDVWFAAWFTYDESGDPAWYVMPRGERASMAEEFGGTLYRTSGPSYLFPTWDASAVAANPVGTMHFRFSDGEHGTMEAVVNGVRVVKPISRQVFAASVPSCTSSSSTSTHNLTDLWWKSGGTEPGWGLFLTHQGDNVFAVWFMYVNGKSAWFVASNVAKVPAESQGTVEIYRGTLYRTSGPPFNASPWNSAAVKPVALGSVTLGVQAGKLVFTWVDGAATGQKAMERQAFSTVRTNCSP